MMQAPADPSPPHQLVPETARKEYNDVFERLVDGFNERDELDEKLVGMVAYALYKECKREFVSSFLNRNGKNPSPADVETWAIGVQKNQLETLKQFARSKIYQFAIDFHQTQADEYQDSVQKELSQKYFSALHGRFDGQEGLIKAQIDSLRTESRSLSEQITGLNGGMDRLVTASGAFRSLGWNILGGFMGTVLAIAFALAIQSGIGQATIKNLLPDGRDDAKSTVQ